MNTPAEEHPDALLADYSVDGLPAAETRIVEGHLATCPRCRARLESLRTTAVLLRSLPEPPLPRSFTLRQSPPASRRPLTLPVSLLSAAAVLLLAFGLSLALYPPRTTGLASTASRPAALVAAGSASAAAAAPSISPGAAAEAGRQTAASSAAAAVSQASEQAKNGIPAVRRPFAAAAPSSAISPGAASGSQPTPVAATTSTSVAQSPAPPRPPSSLLQVSLGVAGVICLLAGVASLALRRRGSAG